MRLFYVDLITAINKIRGRRKSFFVVPETNMIRLGGEPKSQVDRHCTYDMYMHAIFVVQHSKLCSFQTEGRDPSTK